MSVSTEVQRTLVKSPPELWSELSSPDRLGYHLGEVGEIRVTKVEPECKVEWEADGAKGVVELEQSGWGTRVTLSLTRELPAVEATVELDAEAPSEAEAPSAPVRDPEVVHSGLAREAEPAPVAELEPLSESEPVAEPEPFVIVHPEPPPEPEPAAQTPSGFFARLFRRRKIEPVEAPRTPEPTPEIVALAMPEPTYPPAPPPVEPPPEPTPGLAAELANVESQMKQETAELLTGVLDRLGAAHHRPFSRG
jgi:hypothetical protein